MNALYIVTVYVVLADSLSDIGYQDDPRSQVTAAEVLTVAVIASRYFHNHYERALYVLVQQGDIPPLSVSRFNRRLHHLLGWLRRLSAQIRRRIRPATLYLVDAFPLPVCKRVRQRRCRKVRGERFLGRCDAKGEWFFGYKLHWCCDAAGVPLAATLRPARRHERSAVRVLLAHLPTGATVVGDGAYVSHKRMIFWQRRGIRLIAKRYGRMSPNTEEEQVLLRHRQMIETVHSQLESMGLQRLRARTRSGFCLKVMCSLFALMLVHLMPH
jgi:IS5 family transposase